MNLNSGELKNSVTSKNQLEENAVSSSFLNSNGEKTDLNIDPLQKLLNSENTENQILGAQLVAELAKIPVNRELFTNKRIICLLIKCFDKHEDELTMQICRAIANISFENEKAQLLLKEDELKAIISELKSSTYTNNEKLRMVLSGCLFNVLVNNNELQKKSIEIGILDVLEEIFGNQLSNFEKNEEIFVYLLSLLNILTDHLEENSCLTKNLLKMLVEILKVSRNFEISTLCLETVQGQLSNNDTKLFLAKEGICELVFQLIEEYKNHIEDEDSRSLLKSACDLIVLILTGDESMDYLYNKGEGQLYKNMLLWLDSDDVDLKSTGILAIGNFARNDNHCIQMTQNNIAKKLLDILSKNNTPVGDIKLQHALLSTLKNLVIPLENKTQILSQGLIKISYPMLQITHETVIFKLLGTLRMVIDSQEQAALDLATRQDFVEKLVEYCFNSDHVGVRGEASRLLAWLVKHCHSSKPYPLILDTKDSIRSLVEMISSNFAVMQNEALYALNLMCFFYFNKDKEEEYSCKIIKNGIQENEEFTREKGEEKLSQALRDADVGKHLSFILNRYKDKMEKETLQNIVTFLEQLIKLQEFTEHLRDSNVHEALCKIDTQKNDEQLLKRIDALIQIFESR